MKPKATLHPFIKVYFNTGAEEGLYLLELLEEYLEHNPSEPILEVLKDLLHQRKIFYKNGAKVLAKAAKLSLKRIDPDLIILFFSEWAKIATSIGKAEEARVVLKQAIECGKNHKIHLLTDVRLKWMSMADQPIKEKLEKASEIISMLDFTIPGSEPIYITYLQYYCFYGLGELLPKMKKFKKITTNKKWLTEYRRRSYFNCLETINLKDAKEIFSEEMQRTAPYSEFSEPIVQIFYRFLQERQQFNLSEVDLNHPSFCGNLAANYYLLKHDPHKAYEVVSKDLLLQPIKIALNTYQPFFMIRTLIRVTLANKQVKLARRLLLKLRNEIESYIDDFYFARIELLEGNFKKAGQYFSQAIKACHLYKADELLKFELDLAVEIEPSCLYNLMTYVHKNKNKENLICDLDLKAEQPKESKGITAIKGVSNSIKEALGQIKKCAALDIPVIIRGETGVGKDIVACAIHQQSKRSCHPFLAINCGTISESLLQTELFGHTEGAYTGAGKESKGIFESAGDGTVFLDEIGEISTNMQIALLRVLEANEIRPVGSPKSKPFSCRVLFATNAPLEKLVEDKKFRRDLYYRIVRLSVNLAPLRDRTEDIPVLVEHFLKEYSLEEEPALFDAPLMNFFTTYHWPGNVRELKNEVERMCLLNPEKRLLALEDSEIYISSMKITPSKGEKSLSPHQIKKLPSIESFRNPRRRLKRLKEYFTEYQELTRIEVMELINISGPTATTLLKKLVEENFIEKIKPNPAPRTHYFILKN